MVSGRGVLVWGRLSEEKRGLRKFFPSPGGRLQKAFSYRAGRRRKKGEARIEEKKNSRVMGGHEGGSTSPGKPVDKASSRETTER